MKNIERLFFSVFLVFLIISCEKDSNVIKVFHAGSLSVPFKEIVKEFEDKYPGHTVQLESAGSLSCIRKITELKKNCDVLAVADFTLIDELMIPDYATFNILFASNELAIGYLPGSVWEKKVNEFNWPYILLSDSVRFGRSDPNHDPSGYRTVILAGLTQKLFGIPEFQEKFLAKNRKYVRPKGTEIIPLLTEREIDFIFHYSSVLVQHKLAMIRLPDSLNLSTPELNGWYSTVCVNVDGNKVGEKIKKCGESMIYGICIPENSLNKKAAEKFIEFVLKRGSEILKNNGQPVLQPELSEGSIINPEWYKQLKLN